MEWEVSVERACYGLETLTKFQNRLNHELSLGLDTVKASLFLTRLNDELAAEKTPSKNHPATAPFLGHSLSASFVSISVNGNEQLPPFPPAPHRAVSTADIPGDATPAQATRPRKVVDFVSRFLRLKSSGTKTKGGESTRNRTSDRYWMPIQDSKAYDPFKLDPESLFRALNINEINKCRADGLLDGYMNPLVAATSPPHVRSNLEQFHLKHQKVDPSFTLTKLRKLKRVLGEICVRNPAIIELTSATCAWVFFERLVEAGHVTKENRYQLLCATVLLAAKFVQDKTKSPEIREVLNALALSVYDRRIGPKDIVKHEYDVLVWLSYDLITPWERCEPHYIDLQKQTDWIRGRDGI